MKVIKDIRNYWELKDNSWSGALDTLKDIEKADKEEELMSLLEEVFTDKTPTQTEVNDFLWFEREYIYENIGLNEDGELPTIFDTLEKDILVNEIDLESMKEAGIFPNSILSDLEEQINSSNSGLGHILKEDVKTEEQAEWILDNL